MDDCAHDWYSVEDMWRAGGSISVDWRRCKKCTLQQERIFMRSMEPVRLYGIALGHRPTGQRILVRDWGDPLPETD